MLTGQKIDRQFYDALNSYTGEAGSDGIIRVAAANMNYSLLKLRQEGTNGENLVVAKMTRTQPMAFGVLPGCSHSGKKWGIIRSVTMDNAATHPTALWVLKCLQVKSRSAYSTLAKELDKVTIETQQNERVEVVKTLLHQREYITNRYSMIIFRLIDDRGNRLTDYELYLTAGPKYSENALPTGFFVDRQQNQLDRGKLTYFLDYDIMEAGINTPKMQGNLGFRIKAYPEASDKALAYYRMLDFHSSLADINKIIHPNETVLVEVMLQRRVDKTVFSMTNNLIPEKISVKPTGSQVD